MKLRNTSTFTAAFLCFAFIHTPLASILPFPPMGPMVSADYDSILTKTWQGIKKRNIDNYSTGLVHRPKSELSGDAVSEGIGYGMLLALYANDQEYFNKIWAAGDNTMWNSEGNFYDWRVNSSGAIIGTGAATDADQDAALALIFADILVKKGVWKEYKLRGEVSYTQRANAMINSIWDNMIEAGRYVKPGTWGGAGHLNPGYFAPAFYKVFDEFEETDHDWQAVVDQCYQSIEASPGYALGMVPDWMSADGNFTSGASGYNGNFDGKMLFKDAIRILWRIATDYHWFGDSRAKKFLQNAYRFIKTPERANYYDMEGNLIPDSTYSAILDLTIERGFREYSHLTLGMWICAAFGGGGAEAAEPFSDSLLKFYEGGDYWGLAHDPNGEEDTLHNEMYFDQFLAWFGASLVSGNFGNLWDIVNDPNPSLPLAWLKEPKFSIDTGYDANINPVQLTGILNKAATWSISIENQDGNGVYSTSGKGDTVSLTWLGTGENLSPCPAGWYTAKINARGFSEEKRMRFWLGRALDISDGDLLIVDNYKDGDLKPFLGNQWQSFFGEDAGQINQNNTEIIDFKVIKENNNSSLHWHFKVSGSFGWDPYAGLDWNIGHSMEGKFSNLEKIVITAKAQSALGVSVQLIQEGVSVYYFEDSLYLSDKYQTFTLKISDFSPRMNGSTTLDLSKLTAIRFQVQLPEGTVNSIILQDMKLGGQFTSLYEPPLPYVKMPEISIFSGKARKSSDMSVKVIGNRQFLITIPGLHQNAQVNIFGLDGSCIQKLQIRNGNAIWNSRNSSGKMVPPGIYAIRLNNNGKSIRKNVLICK